MKFITSTLLFLSIFLSGCISEEERKARQDNAFDISGKYQTTEDLDVPFQFEITNQDAKHDIVIKLSRSNPLTDLETTLLSNIKTEHGITSDDILNQPAEMTFGETLGLDLDGGDNISTDFGETSRFSMCSNHSKYKSNKKEADKKYTNILISYCLSGVVKKESKNKIEGQLTLKASVYYKSINEKGEEKPESDTNIVEFYYKAEKVTSASN